MPPTASYLAPLPPDDPLRQALMASLTREHRPDLADLLASADLFLEARGLWVRPPASFGTVSPVWLAPHLQTAACEAGLDLDWIQILANPQGGAACPHLFGPRRLGCAGAAVARSCSRATAATSSVRRRSAGSSPRPWGSITGARV